MVAYAAVSPDLEGLTGQYLDKDKSIGEKNPLVLSRENKQKLWNFCWDTLQRLGLLEPLHSDNAIPS